MRNPSEIADDIEATLRWHATAYPSGDYGVANDRLTQLFFEAEPLLRAAGLDPYKGGNEGRVRALRDIAAREAKEDEG